MSFWNGFEVPCLILHHVPNNLLTPSDINTWTTSSSFDSECWLDFALGLNPIELAQCLPPGSPEDKRRACQTSPYWRGNSYDRSACLASWICITGGQPDHQVHCLFSPNWLQAGLREIRTYFRDMPWRNTKEVKIILYYYYQLDLALC